MNSKYSKFPREIVAPSGQGYTIVAYFSPSTGTYSYGVREGDGPDNLYVVQVSDYHGLETRILMTMEDNCNHSKLVAHTHGDSDILRALMLCVDACEGWLPTSDEVFNFYGAWEIKRRGTG